MSLETGKIYDGKVRNIAPYGAFVEVNLDGKVHTGMVHISEISNTYVNEIRDHLTEGQEVKVKVLNVDENGKISLSIKKASESPAPKPRTQRNNNQRVNNQRSLKEIWTANAETPNESDKKSATYKPYVADFLYTALIIVFPFFIIFTMLLCPKQYKSNCAYNYCK